MGKRHHSSLHEGHESVLESDNGNSGRYFEKCSSHKYQYNKSDNCELESSKHEKRHKRRRQNREKSCEQEIISDQIEKESRRSSQRKRIRRDHSNYEKNIKTERKDEEEWGKQITHDVKQRIEEKDKETVNFGLSGKLTEDANTYNGIVIKYNQPPEARKPKRRWRWYIFKGDTELPFLPLHRESAYLIGRERKVADIPIDNPSCSKQHAVLQYRYITYDHINGTKRRTVKPYILDLESGNGTFVNNRRIESRRYVELMEKDVVKFGFSSREYVLLHEESKGNEDDEPSQEAEISPISLFRSG